jgi:hypothetical protein
MIPQSQTIKPTPDEIASDSLNQESTATETHEIAHHPIPKIDQAFESQSQLKVSAPAFMTLSVIGLRVPPSQDTAISPPNQQSPPTSRPPEYETWTNNRKYRWRKRYEPNYQQIE